MSDESIRDWMRPRDEKQTKTPRVELVIRPAPFRSVLCPMCDVPMEPENAHDRCPKCGFRTHCCEGSPG